MALLPLLVALFSPQASRQADVPTVVQRAAWVMGTELRLTVVTPDREAGLRAAEAALAAVREVDGLLSTWREDTELQRVNRARPGHPVRLSPVLTGFLAEVWEWWRETDGTFDPAVGPLISAWGVRGAPRTPGAAELARARQASGLQQFEFDPGGRTMVRRQAGAWMDSGGFGKGAALRSVEAVLRASGVRSALVDFGGQGLALGSSPEEKAGGGWTIGVAHPAERLVPVRELAVGDRSVSTSGQSEQPGHILDPRSGRPVPAWGTVTVVTRDPMVADILSTALFVMGPEAGLRWANPREDIGVLFLVIRDGRLEERWNRAMEPFLKERQ